MLRFRGAPVFGRPHLRPADQIVIQMTDRECCHRAKPDACKRSSDGITPSIFQVKIAGQSAMTGGAVTEGLNRAVKQIDRAGWESASNSIPL